MKNYRTDMAVELHAGIVGGDKSKEIEGVILGEEKSQYVDVTTLDITNENGEKLIGRPVGKYITLEFGKVGMGDADKFTAITDILTEKIKELAAAACGERVPHVLVAGLGNEQITADRIGPQALRSVIVTRHLKNICRGVFDSFGGVEITAISTDVLAHTGMESAEILSSLVSTFKPSLVIVIDALASNTLSRLASAIQVTNTGIKPGSGVGNHRRAIDMETLGIPVISIGVPMVVDAATLAYDVIMELRGENADGAEEDDGSFTLEDLRERLTQKSRNCYVTPKDGEALTADIAKMIGFAVDKAFLKDITYDEIARLVM